MIVDFIAEYVSISMLLDAGCGCILLICKLEKYIETILYCESIAHHSRVLRFLY